jgi:hypothetical protein
MMSEGPSELHARWAVAQNMGRFQELLNEETEDGKYKILAQLLSHEMEQLKERRVSSPAPLPNPPSALRYRQTEVPMALFNATSHRRGLAHR